MLMAAMGPNGRFNVFQGQELDGNGTTQMGPAIESPMVLEGNWSPDGTMDNPGFECYAGTHF
eukprot:CAMPEP_0180150590 /NCGR_PEP_ID=MMETSP0986-20121125/21563_1 /TAXON_ID=697907 /ORGANISM="non described non described, Strain CCMP2293" /LENGTH=61 /DNA_ID=CAMNT_0022097601 /DNA_START=17 /DNA_END=202 /DNA_ORIENTATION=+